MRRIAHARSSLVEANAAVRRVTPGALALRVVVFVAGLAALALVLPRELYVTVPGVLLALAALLCAGFPDTWAVAALELGIVVGWLVDTTAFAQPVTWLPVTALAASLYLHHSASAWAAAIPLETILDWTVWWLWLRRVAAVLGCTALLATGGLALAGALQVRAPLAIPMVGIVAAIALAVLLAYLLHGGGGRRTGD